MCGAGAASTEEKFAASHPARATSDSSNMIALKRLPTLIDMFLAVWPAVR
jgi:3-deoxy-D-manno-octulosonic acid (KDO) 8-phosphate synthase